MQSLAPSSTLLKALSVRAFTTTPFLALPPKNKKNMPPKKTVVEKKTALGRPGNK